MKRFTIKKHAHGSTEWLRDRKWNSNGEVQIGASDAAAVHGEHPYKSRADLASELMSKDDPQPVEPNAAMERGNRLEPTLIKWAADRENAPFVTPDWMYCFDDDGVRLIATIDAVAYPEEPECRILEVKTINKRWAGELPRHWYWQGVQQAICTGSFRIEWAIFDSDLALHKHIQKVTSDEMQIHVDACCKFLAAIDMGIVPENVVFEYEHVSRQHGKGDGTSKTLDEATVMGALERLALAREQKRSAETMEEVIKAELCSLLGDAEFGLVNGDVAFTWKTQSRNMFDLRKFEAEHPALAAKFRRDVNTRTFRVVAK